LTSTDNEWRKAIEARIDGIGSWVGRVESRISLLEAEHGLNGKPAACLPEVLELDLELPGADIGGLHWNKQEVRAVFDLKDDGVYYSRDILFVSARDTDEGTGRDLLTEYLNRADFRLALAEAIFEDFNALTVKYGDAVSLADCLEVSLPETNQGVKKYNGVGCGYWLRPHSAAASSFCDVNNNGSTYNSYAGYAGGCAPAFRVRAKGGKE
jgi:hypothetical protein